MRWRGLYIRLLRLHPPGFRHVYADEMLWIFDEAAARGSVAPLFADALGSLCRQWFLRPRFAAPEQKPRMAAGAPPFLGIEQHGLSRGALLNGALISALTFAGVFYCSTHGAGHWEGLQQAFYALAAENWSAAEDAQPPADEVQPANAEALVSLIMSLDVNGDGIISRTERRGWLAARYRELLSHTYASREGGITRENLSNEISWRMQQGWAIDVRPTYPSGR